MNERDGFVESRIRILILEFEKTPNLMYAVPSTDKFSDPNGPPTNQSYFLGLVMKKVPDSNDKTIDLSYAVSSFTTLLTSYPNYLPTMQIAITYKKRFVAF